MAERKPWAERILADPYAPEEMKQAARDSLRYWYGEKTEEEKRDTEECFEQFTWKPKKRNP